MSYVDSYLDRKHEKVKVVERFNKKRIFRELTPQYEFYSEDPYGTVKSITGKTVTRHSFKTHKEMKEALMDVGSAEVFESDLNVLFRTLYTNYKDSSAPELNVCFFDIETDFHEEKGWAPVDDPYNQVTAISMYLAWTSRLITLVIKPQTLTTQEAKDIVSLFDTKEGEVYLCNNEKHMLSMFFELIEDSDVLSGWNSSVYDIPYLVNRVEMIFSKAETTRLCLWGQAPKPKTIENFGKDVVTYDLVGRVHMDYLELYKKHALQEEASYNLNAIGEKVVKQNKVQYDGNLDQLYNENFEKFIEYSLMDSKLLYMIDQKLDYINLHNQLAHSECIPLLTTMGTVSLVDTAIINEIHRNNEVVFNKRPVGESSGAAGAWVQDPVVGIHKTVGVTDFNSLYPSTIRSLNMSPECIVGQVRQDYTNEFLAQEIEKQRRSSRSKNFEPNYTEAWHSLFGSIEYTKIMEKTQDGLTVDLEDGSCFQCTADELYDTIFADDSTLVISANGTLFDKSKMGIIPKVLAKWYAERKLFKRASGDCKQLSGTSALDKENGYTTEEMNKTYDGVTRFAWFAEHEPNMKLVERDGKWFAENSEYASSRYNYYDKVQYIKKILLNSCYGALLSSHSRFFDKRLGQSTTLTGRAMAKHMASMLNQVITGTYIHHGGAVLYGDSVVGETLIDTNQGKITIEDLYNNSTILKDWDVVYNCKPLYGNSEIKVRTFDKTTNATYFEFPERILKHENSTRYVLRDEHGNSVKCTSDHGIPVEVDGAIRTCSPDELNQFLTEGRIVYLIGK